MRFLIKPSVAAGVLLSASLAHSIELFETVSLPGANGKPMGSFMDYTDDSCMVVGVYAGAVGQVAAVWDLDNDGALQSMTTLPLPTGYTGEAIGGAMFPNGDIAVVGNVFVNGNPLNPRAALWRKTALGAYNITILSLGMSRIADSEYGGPANPHLAVVGGAFTGGRWRGYFTDVMISSVVGQILPYIEQDAFALGVDLDAGGDVTVFGWATFPSSLRKPCHWVGPDFNTIQFVNIPNAAAGQAEDGDVDGADFLAWGSYTNNGRTRGSIYNANPANGLIGLLLPLKGFFDSALTDPLYLGDAVSQDVGHWMGRSTSPNGALTPTIWTDMRPLSAQQLLLDPLSITLTDVMVSSYRDEANEDMEVRLMGQSSGPSGLLAEILVPSSIIVPDFFDMIAGEPASKDWHVGDMWHDDSKELALRTHLVNGQRMAILEVFLGRLAGYEQTAYPLESTFSVVARAVGTGTGSSGRLRVHLYNYETQSFIQMTDVMISSFRQRVDVNLTDARPYLIPSSWEMRARIEFEQNGNRPSSFSLNYVGIDE